MTPTVEESLLKSGGRTLKRTLRNGPVLRYICGMLGENPDIDRHGLYATLEGLVINMPAGRTISRRGKPSASFILLSGWACQQRISFDGNRQIFAFLTPGDFLGTNTIHNGGNYADVVAITPVSAIAIKTIGRHNDEIFRSRISAAACDGEAYATSRLYDSIVLLGQCSAYVRLACLLMELYDRMDRVGLAVNQGITFPLTQELIGSALGISSVHVNRTMQQLRRENILEITGGRLVIKNLAGMRRIADQVQQRATGVTCPH